MGHPSPANPRNPRIQLGDKEKPNKNLDPGNPHPVTQQIGNPDGKEKPNKKYYDPRQWTRKGETALVERMKLAFEDLNAINVL